MSDAWLETTHVRLVLHLHVQRSTCPCTQAVHMYMSQSCRPIAVPLLCSHTIWGHHAPGRLCPGQSITSACSIQCRMPIRCMQASPDHACECVGTPLKLWKLRRPAAPLTAQCPDQSRTAGTRPLRTQPQAPTVVRGGAVGLLAHPARTAHGMPDQKYEQATEKQRRKVTEAQTARRRSCFHV